MRADESYVAGYRIRSGNVYRNGQPASLKEDWLHREIRIALCRGVTEYGSSSLLTVAETTSDNQMPDSTRGTSRCCS